MRTAGKNVYPEIVHLWTETREKFYHQVSHTAQAQQFQNTPVGYFYAISAQVYGLVGHPLERSL